MIGSDIEARVKQRLAEAARVRAAGDQPRAARLLESAVSEAPASAPALNALGLECVRSGDLARAVALFERAIRADPRAVALRLNLADAFRRGGDHVRELAAVDGALAIDPYLLPALIAKAVALEELGERRQSARVYRALMSAYPDAGKMSPAVQAVFAHGRSVIAADNDAAADRLAAPLAAAYAENDGADLRRARAYVDQVCGRRKVYAAQPTGSHFPFLPAYEYFDEALFPWFAELEAGTDAIARELAGIWGEGEDAPAPYVAFAPGIPVNQWAELNHSPRWGCYFLWKDGALQEQNIARCPETAALMERLPLLDLAGKGPTVMFSILEPNTRIPPHTGVTNVRTTIHLPLVVPGQCRFRVGGETREWVYGKAWAFDDTIEHEAWNDSDRPRAILIIDCWNPLLSDAERAVVRAAGG